MPAYMFREPPINFKSDWHTQIRWTPPPPLARTKQRDPGYFYISDYGTESQALMLIGDFRSLVDYLGKQIGIVNNRKKEHDDHSDQAHDPIFFSASRYRGSSPQSLFLSDVAAKVASSVVAFGASVSGGYSSGTTADLILDSGSAAQTADDARKEMSRSKNSRRKSGPLLCVKFYLFGDTLLGTRRILLKHHVDVIRGALEEL